ncbi:MAG: MAPEG family protein, partial [Xanthobacteraceae bacterium]|nr:MAPEG family protein [Xanthobacteraceae bacterium]
MTVEFKLLIWSLALTFVQMLIATVGTLLHFGPSKAAGNREWLPELPGWAGRARRAHLNMIENMVLFVPLILIADIAGRDNAMTERGAELFFWARLAYAAIYLAGIPYLRTLAWIVSAV